MASSDEQRQLREHAEQASFHLQQIQNLLGHDGSGVRVTFPRGYLKPVSARIGRFGWINSDTLRRNICYHLMYADMLRWLLNRTDIAGVAKCMLVKHLIIEMGLLAETLSATAEKQFGRGKVGFERRMRRLVDHNAITAELSTELVWLWTTRSAIHLHEVEELELDSYTLPAGNRAAKAVDKLIGALNGNGELHGFEVIPAPA